MRRTSEIQPRDDVQNLAQQVGQSEFPYVEVRVAERGRAAATRWPLLVSTNRMLGMAGQEGQPAQPSRVRSADPAFPAPPPDDPQTRDLEAALPIIRSTRLYATIPKEP